MSANTCHRTKQDPNSALIDFAFVKFVELGFLSGYSRPWFLRPMASALAANEDKYIKLRVKYSDNRLDGVGTFILDHYISSVAHVFISCCLSVRQGRVCRFSQIVLWVPRISKTF